MGEGSGAKSAASMHSSHPQQRCSILNLASISISRCSLLACLRACLADRCMIWTVVCQTNCLIPSSSASSASSIVAIFYFQVRTRKSTTHMFQLSCRAMLGLVTPTTTNSTMQLASLASEPAAERASGTHEVSALLHPLPPIYSLQQWTMLFFESANCVMSRACVIGF